MARYFEDCNTVEELNKRRQDIMSELNSQYGEKKKELLNRVPPFKRIPLIRMNSIESIQPVSYVPFPMGSAKVKANEIIFDATGAVSF